MLDSTSIALEARFPSSLFLFLLANLSFPTFLFFPLFHLPSFPLVLLPLANWPLSTFWSRAWPPWGPQLAKVVRRWRPELLLATLWSAFPIFLPSEATSKSQDFLALLKKTKKSTMRCQKSTKSRLLVKFGCIWGAILALFFQLFSKMTKVCYKRRV